MRRSFYLIPIFLLLFLLPAQSQKFPSSLLWKISGNGLAKPSYLYGTMHLTDERLFELGDSLYNAIEQTEGFAIEVNPEELSSLMIDQINKKLNDGRLLKDMIDDSRFKQYRNVLSKKFNKPADKITSQDILMEKNRWINESYKEGKMSTALDAYLYDIARRQGKWTGGIEDLSDQSGLLNELIDENDIEWIASEGGDKRSALYMEAMIQFYLNADLNSIDSITNFKDSAYIEALITRRNIKMARRMDSLSSLRSMTFAVGAAHLPGKMGVIQLLRNKGFIVDPVFYSKTIAPANYTVKEINIPWLEVNDTKGYYTAQMPGRPGDIKMFGIMEMKMYFDIFSSSGFFTTSMAIPYDDRGVDSVIKVVAGNFFGKENIENPKPITVNGVKGREWGVTGKDGYRRGYILNNKNVIYIALGYSLKKNTRAEADISKFLTGYKAFEKSTYTFEPVVYTDSVLAFSVEIPSKAESADNLAGKREKGMNSHISVSVDNRSGTYYMFGVNEVAPGFYIENDSTTFENIRTNLKEQFSNVDLDTMYTKNNSRVLEYSGRMKQGIYMRTYYRFRGNRWYSLVAMYNSSNPDAFIDRFFSSFTFLNYPALKWERQVTADSAVAAWAPGIFEKSEDTGTVNATITYRAFDSTRADSYYIFEQSYSKYYWQSSDSIFWKNLVDQNVSYNDTLLHKAYVYNGKEKGIELLIQQKNAGNIFRKRIWPRGNKLYSVYTVQPMQYIRSSNINKFFEEVAFNKPVADEHFIFTSKAENLLNDLLSKDSVTRSEAKAAMPNADFSKTDAGLLNNALLKKYEGDEDEVYEIRNSILSHIMAIQDSSSLLFAKNNYTKSAGAKPFLLDIISAYKTLDNYLEMKELILSSPPEKELNYRFESNLDDSLLLTVSIIKDLLPLYKDTIFSEVLTGITDKMIDSNLLSINVLKNYQPDILRHANHRYNIIKANKDDYAYTDYKLISLLGKLKTTQSNAMLQKWLNLPALSIVSDCVDKLMADKQIVPAKIILQLASKDDYRIECYNTLKKYKKLTLFPKQYLAQKHFAKSLIYNYANDDYETSDIVFHSAKAIDCNGKKKNVYIFKVGYKEEEKEFFYMTGAGPFNINAADMSIDDAMVYMLNEEFEASNSAQQIDSILKQLEKMHKESEGD